MGKQPLNRSNHTYADYLTWEDGKRWELIDGEAYDMTPTPLTIHQTLVVELSYQLMNQFRDKSCQVYLGPFDVRFPRQGRKTTRS